MYELFKSLYNVYTCNINLFISLYTCYHYVYAITPFKLLSEKFYRLNLNLNKNNICIIFFKIECFSKVAFFQLTLYCSV